MAYQVRFTRGARQELTRLFGFLTEKDEQAADRALESIKKGITLLEEFLFNCRKVDVANPFFRELLIPFGSSGYVLLFEIEGEEIVTVLAARHQREEDYF